MIRLRSIINIITFPGVIIHEFAHKKYCDWTGTPVLQVCYFRLGDPQGFVVHEQPEELSAAFAISAGSLIINTLCGMALPLAAFLFNLFSWQFFMMWWIGISAGMHAFPSNDDALNFKQQVRQHRGRISLLFLFSILFQAIIRMANALKFIWFDLWYASAISLAGPVYFGLIPMPSFIQAIARYAAGALR